MAQFSSLEQITNMSTGFQKLSGLLASSEASQVLGKTVELHDGANYMARPQPLAVSGEVEYEVKQNGRSAPPSVRRSKNRQPLLSRNSSSSRFNAAPFKAR